MFGCWERISAATPATNGVDNDVPLPKLYDPLALVEKMDVPGAAS